MTLWLLGLNHQTAPVDLRERVAFAGDSAGRALASLRALPDVSEAALLSTCNRTEIYAVARDGDALAGWMDGHAQGLAPYLYRHHDADAVRHLFRVATGLDSMVLGEPQILGQVKDAWSLAREHGALGNRLDRLFQQTFAVAKRARTDTRIGVNPVSVASTAVRLAQNSFASLPDSTVLLIGAGGAAAGVLGPLLSAGPALLTVVNRTHQRAADLVERHADWARIQQVPLRAVEVGALQQDFDIVVNATASSLAGGDIPVPAHVLRPGALALDMMYGPAAQGFLDWAHVHGATPRDGLGMLVEQAAESFRIWRGVRPPSAQVLAELRALLPQPATPGKPA